MKTPNAANRNSEGKDEQSGLSEMEEGIQAMRDQLAQKLAELGITPDELQEGGDRIMRTVLGLPLSHSERKRLSEKRKK